MLIIKYPMRAKQSLVYDTGKSTVKSENPMFKPSLNTCQKLI